MVGNGVPLHCTVELLRKPEPITVMVKASPPAGTEAGLMLVSTSEVTMLFATVKFTELLTV